jgi:hypothetical protein
MEQKPELIPDFIELIKIKQGLTEIWMIHETLKICDTVRLNLYLMLKFL